MTKMFGGLTYSDSEFEAQFGNTRSKPEPETRKAADNSAAWTAWIDQRIGEALAGFAGDVGR